MSISKKIAIVSSLLLMLNACGGGGSSSSDTETQLADTQTTTEGNLPPVVDAGEDRKVEVDKPVTIYGQANDPDGYISEFEWRKGDEVISTSVQVTYIPTEIGKVTLTLIAIDNDGASSSDDIVLEVVEELNSQTTTSSAPNEDGDNPLPF